MFELNDKVVILSGGISGFPTVSLAGVQGRVVSPHPSTPDGWIAVWVDWSKTPYKNVAGLPNPINNTPEMIDYADGEAPAPKAARQPGHLQSVSRPAQESPSSPETPEPAAERPPSPFKLI
jgi:hypothetical protein